MTDFYTKGVLTVIAIALLVIAYRGFNFVDPAQASYAPVQKVQICNRSGQECVDILPKTRSWGSVNRLATWDR